MNNQDISQEHVDKYLAMTDEFWETSQKSLKAPFSIFNDSEIINHCTTKELWAQTINSIPDHVAVFNIIFDNAPVLKGEFPAVCARKSGTILTNYRLFYKAPAGLHIIPLKDLISYSEPTEGEPAVIEYNRHGETLSIVCESNYMDPEFVQSVINAKEFKDLEDIQNRLLSMTFYDFEKKNLTAPKIEFLVTDDTKFDKSFAKWGMVVGGCMIIVSFLGYALTLYLEYPNESESAPWWVLLFLFSLSIVGFGFWDLIKIRLGIQVKEKTMKGGGTGILAGCISCVLAVLGILTIGFVFVPLAAIVAIFGSLKALGNLNLGGIGVNILAWVLTIVGLISSPVLLSIIGVSSMVVD